MTPTPGNIEGIVERERGLHRGLSSAPDLHDRHRRSYRHRPLSRQRLRHRLRGSLRPDQLCHRRSDRPPPHGVPRRDDRRPPDLRLLCAYAEHYISPLAGFLVRYSYWSPSSSPSAPRSRPSPSTCGFGTPPSPATSGSSPSPPPSSPSTPPTSKFFGSVEYAFSLFKILAIAAFILLGGYVLLTAPAGSGVGFGNYVAHGGFFPHGLSGTWIAVIVAIFSYFSIEMVAVAAGEAADPARAITRAFRATILRLIFVYLLSLAVMLAIVPWNTAGTATSPFVLVAAATGIPYAAGILNLVVLIAALSAMNSQIYITTRMMFSLSRAGFAPRRFGALNSRGVPISALLLSSIGIALASHHLRPLPASAFTLMMSISMFGALFTWLMIFVTHLRFRHAHAATPLSFRMPASRLQASPASSSSPPSSSLHPSPRPSA